MNTFGVKNANGKKIHIFDQFETRVNDESVLKYLLASHSKDLILKVQFVSDESSAEEELFTSKVLYSFCFYVLFFWIYPLHRKHLFYLKDVEDYLKKNGGKPIFAEYERLNTLTEQMRHKLVNILVDLLIERYGLYPKIFEKIMIAKAAIGLFPKFKVDGTEHGTVRVN